MNPTGVVGRESSVGDDAVDVRMKQQVLSKSGWRKRSRYVTEPDFPLILLTL